MPGKEDFILKRAEIAVFLLTDVVILPTVTTHSISSQKEYGEYLDKHPIYYLSIFRNHTNRSKLEGNSSAEQEALVDQVQMKSVFRSPWKFAEGMGKYAGVGESNINRKGNCILGETVLEWVNSVYLEVVQQIQPSSR